MSNYPFLDRPMWDALTTTQAGLARGTGGARRYRSDISALAGVRSKCDAHLEDLAKLLPDEDYLVVAQTWEVGCPPGGDILDVMPVVQMVSDGTNAPVRHDAEIIPLGEADWPDMYALAMKTKPGPYLLRTPLLGGYVGVKQDGKLIAMAGQRMQMDRHVEVSAICTDPAHQGKGLGTAITMHLCNQIIAQGKVPCLHAYAANAVAIRLYEQLGFRTRQDLWVSHIAKAT